MFRQSLYFRNVVLLGADGPMGQTLRIKRGKVAEIDGTPHKRDRIIDGQGALVIPGLINGHDHLELNTFKRLKYRQRYSHALQWIEDIEAHFDTDPNLINPRQEPLAERLFVSALKNLLSGVTTVCHHNPLHRTLRFNYPIRVVKNYGFCHSLFRGEDPVASYQATRPKNPWIIHLAEGVDETAATEFDRIDRLGLVQKNTVLIHGVGLTAAQQTALIERGGGLVWCPGSNQFMFGQTASVEALARAGKLALGSDSRLSGEFDLLGELRLAGETKQISPRQLFQAVTTNTVRILRLTENGLGRITVGGVADLVFVPAEAAEEGFSSISRLTRSQLVLVMYAGNPVVGDPRMQPVFKATWTNFEPVWLDETKKLMSARLVRRLMKLSVQESGLTVEPPQ